MIDSPFHEATHSESAVKIEGGGPDRGPRPLSSRFPTADDCDALKVAALLWAGCMVLGAVSVTVAQGMRTGDPVMWSASWTYLWILATPLAAIPMSFALYRLMLLLADRPLWFRILILSPAVVSAALLQGVYDHESGVTVARLFGARTLRPLFSEVLVVNVANYLGLYVLYVCAIELGTMRARAERYARQAARHALQSAEAREQARQAQLELLWSRLNPHFLFNTLNNVISLVTSEDRDRAILMLRRLSTYLRATLDLNGGAMLSLEDELEAAEAYAEIEAVRFDGVLDLDIECPPELRRACVPALILLPLVENAVKYAVAPSRGRASICIRASASDGVLWIEVRDTGVAPGMVSTVVAGTGLGLRNVADRLSTRYGAEAGLDACPGPRGFAARIHLPILLEQDQPCER